MDTVSARCLCGSLHLEAGLPSRWVAHCHCSQCQRGHGAAFVTWVGFDEAACRIDDPEGRLRWFRSSELAERGFCSRCGASLFFRSGRWPGELHVTLANIEGSIDRAPQAHVFWDTHVDWVRLDPADGLPRKEAVQVE